MSNPFSSTVDEFSTHHLWADIGRMLRSRQLSVAIVDMAIHGLFALDADRSLGVCGSIETSIVVHGGNGLKMLLGVDIAGDAIDALRPCIGVEIARNVLEKSGAGLAVVLTLGLQPTALSKCVALDLHWWMRPLHSSQGSWLRSQQSLICGNRDEVQGKMLQFAVQETWRVLQLQDLNIAGSKE